MDAAVKADPISWRDPDGFVVLVQGKVLRAVALEKSEQTRRLLASPWLAGLIESGDIPRTVELEGPPREVQGSQRWLWLQHEALMFPCYPHEITALQLYDSAVLTLRVALQAAEHGWMLKDASAWNVLHSQGRPVFVDLLSFEQTAPTGTWNAYGQFVRNFLLPLLLYRKLAITPPEIFLTNRDGVTPERAYQALGGLSLMSRLAMELVVLPKWLARSGSRMIAAQSMRQRRPFEAEVGKDLLLRTLRRLRRNLEGLRPDPTGYTSPWKNYEEARDHYSEADLAAKKEFVRRGLQNSSRVLDLGCNAGEFSLLAAEAGKTAVAADADHAALSRLYARVRGRGSPITPLMLHIGRPTPAVGWQNSEVASFLDRATGQFDCVLLLGLIHHLLVGERASLPMLAELLERLGPKRVVLEWVDPKDRKFLQLAGMNGDLYSELDSAQLEACMQQKFNLMERLSLPCATRVMYLWSR